MASRAKDPKLDAAHQAILKEMLTKPENKSCADCRTSGGTLVPHERKEGRAGMGWWL